jgi:arginyl-tRNA synthetase
MACASAIIFSRNLLTTNIFISVYFMTVQQQLQNCINDALSGVLPSAEDAAAPEVLRVVPTANPQFGDYQWNGALPLAKILKTNPRALATQILEKLDVSQISQTPEIAGPGFINFRLKREFLENTIQEVARDERLGVPLREYSRSIVVDFSGPNVAKPMHVGHIRSTVIGDAIARLLTFSGARVIRDNHIGDWGTQFGKMIVGWKRHRNDENLERDPIAEMERLYKLVNEQSENDEEVANEARLETAKLQNGDAENHAIWEKLRELSQAQFDKIYSLLNVSFDEVLGESFYNDRLQNVVDELLQKNIAEKSEGAIIIRFAAPPAIADKVLVIRKSDGASTYGTTDLATIQYREERWQPDEVVYVVDARQSNHFLQVFETNKRAEFSDAALKHVSFGTILGEDHRPIKTRSGEPIKLIDLLEEAQKRALEIAREKSSELSEGQLQNVARVIGIGAVKYADLSQNRTSDYVFSWDKMLALQGNTAPYLQYAYVRIRAIFRKAGIENLPESKIVLEHDAEIELAKWLLRFPLAIETALSDYRLNALTDYLFELAQKYNAFYENCPVLQSELSLRESRLMLAKLTGDVLQKGLNLLGIETIEQM